MSQDPKQAKHTRRKFLEIAGGAVVLGGLYSLNFVDDEAPQAFRHRPPGKPPAGLDLVAVQGGPADFGAITEKAITAFGGIEKFVKKGDRVVLSPNIGWMRTPEQAAGTHPDVLRAVVNLCLRAGASRITVVDYALDDPKLAFDICGATSAVRGTKATLISPDDVSMYRDVDIAAAVPKATTDGEPYRCVHASERIRQKAPRALLNADCFICMPVVKDHEASMMTGAMKKLMGVIWNRKDYHRYGLHECIAELNLAMRPTLIVADATRVLQTRGPKGPGEVMTPNTVVVGVDPVAVDSYGTRFLTTKGITPDQVPHLVLGNRLGLGEIDPDKLKVREIA